MLGDLGKDCCLRSSLFSRCFFPPRLPRLVLLVLAVIMLESLMMLPSIVSVYMLLGNDVRLSSLPEMVIGPEGGVDPDLEPVLDMYQD